MEPFLRNKTGLEIGGPSPFFCANRLIPVYDRCREIDSCDFAASTAWSDRRGYDVRFRRHYVTEAADLSPVPDACYDFVLASHVLEHIANPLRALREWSRVLNTGGVMLVLVPDKRYGFDRRRPFTSFEHLEADFAANTQETDLSHLDEVLSLHDLSLDPLAGSAEQFQQRCRQNASVRAMHHHVFSPELLGKMFEHTGLTLLAVCTERPSHIIGLAQKGSAIHK